MRLGHTHTLGCVSEELLVIETSWPGTMIGGEQPAIRQLLCAAYSKHGPALRPVGLPAYAAGVAHSI